MGGWLILLLSDGEQGDVVPTPNRIRIGTLTIKRALVTNPTIKRANVIDPTMKRANVTDPTIER